MQSPFVNMFQDRRGVSRSSHDRRRSQRWKADRDLLFRYESDTEIRTGKVIARSLDGLVVLIDTNDVASPIRRIVAVDSPQKPPAGFRTAVVCRQEMTIEGLVLYAEVES